MSLRTYVRAGGRNSARIYLITIYDEIPEFPNFKFNFKNKETFTIEIERVRKW